MIEDYGTLSEEELLEEITQELEENEIDISNLEFKFENSKLLVLGSLANDVELESLIDVIENHINEDDYELDIDLEEGSSPLITEGSYTGKNPASSDEEEYMDKHMDDMDEGEIDFADEDSFEDDDKW